MVGVSNGIINSQVIDHLFWQVMLTFNDLFHPVNKRFYGRWILNEWRYNWVWRIDWDIYQARFLCPVSGLPLEKYNGDMFLDQLQTVRSLVLFNSMLTDPGACNTIKGWLYLSLTWIESLITWWIMQTPIDEWKSGFNPSDKPGRQK